MSTIPDIPKIFLDNDVYNPSNPIPGRNRATYVVTDQYNSRYYSGEDISIYFNDIYLDDVQSLQYQVTENVLPIYGYSSYSYSFAARGNKIIQGSFTINFKRSFYIQEILNKITEEEASSKLTEKQKDVLKSGVGHSSTLEEILAQIRSNKGEKINTDVLDNIAQEKEKYFWPKVASRARSEDAPMFQEGMDQGFTIFIKYGELPISKNAFSVKKNGEDSPLPKASIGTIQAIRGVQITSCGTILADDGRPILETYSFLGKDIVRGP